MRLTHFTLTLICLLLFSNVNAQLLADFTANTQTGCDFAQINFTNTTTDGGATINCSSNYTYSWDFNPGNSNQCSPGNIFSTPGTYTICLTVTNSTSGETHTECKTDFITIFSLPEPSFTFTPQSGCEPLEVCFQNTSTIQTGNFVSCIWDFGDGEVLDDCTNGQICHTYAQNGNYTVTLTVIDDNNCPPVTATNSLDVFEAPEIMIDADETFGCSSPLTVNFTNNSPVTNNVIFDWTFQGADITTFQGVTPPPITWDTEGSYDVTVISQGPNGCMDTLFLDDYIGLGSSIGFAPSDYSICLGDTIFFTDLSAGTPVSWEWDFGDGTGVSGQENPFYVYNTVGCFSVTLTIDNGACDATFTDPICIDVNEIPVVSFTNDNPIGCEIPHTTTFTPTTSTMGGTYEWIFGTDTLGSSTDMSPSFTFNEFGNHEVTLYYTSTDGCMDSTVNIVVVEEIDVNLQGTSVEGCAPITITLQESSSSIAPINDWIWTVPGIGTFNEESPTVTATDTGSYDVILQVTNEFGCVATDTFEGYIQTGVAQMVDFVGEPLLTCADSLVSFTDLSSPFVDQWFWQFGESPSSISFDQNPTHEYIDTGYFEVCLTVFQNGCENMICKPDYLRILPPVARIAPIDPDCEAPYTYTFESTSIGADSLHWDFGVQGIDTDTSSEIMPTYTFPDLPFANYNVELIAYNFETGCSDTARAVIRPRGIVVDFTIADTIGCAPFSFTPVSNSSSAVRYEWTSLSGEGIITAEDSISPTFQYPNGGLYEDDIQLIAGNIHGCTDTFVTTQDIYVNELVADLTISEIEGCIPFTVTYTDNSTSLFADIVNWAWTDLQGNNQNGPDPQVSFTYTYPDTFDIRLIVTDTLGCTDRIRLRDTIVVTESIAYFESDTFACTEQVINFTNESSGEGLSYLWDFGDTNTSTAMNPTHFFTSEGIFDVCLTTTDINGCDSTFCRIITVANPVANFEADTTFAFCPPLIVSFTNLSQNAVPGGSLWDFGDGTGFSNGDNPSHVYTQGGTFDVTLIVTNESGCLDTIVFDNYIELQGPVGDFDFTYDIGCSPLTVTFTTNSVSPSLHIMDYGDGSIDSSATDVTSNTFVYTYAQAGSYTPALILVDELGCDQVFDAENPILVESLDFDFMATDTLLCDGGTTDFTSTVNSSIPITFLEWTFEGQTPQNSTNPNPSGITYNTNGLYDVKLVVSNGVCTDSIEKTDYIAVEETPTAAFTAVPTPACEGSAIGFTDNSTVGTGSIVAWDWDFDDTNMSTDQNPMNTYQLQGTYDVTLTVSSINGCTDMTSSPVDIVPLPDVTIGPASDICIGESVPLNAQLNTNPTGVSYAWDNGTSLSCSDCLIPLASPVVTTTYTLTATTASGCVDTAQVTVTVIPFPAPDIGLAADTSICENTTIQLLASGGTTDPASYQWDQSSTGLSCYACPNPFASPTVTTEYRITVTGEGGCTAMDTIVVTVFDPSQVFAGPDATICEGESIVLSDGAFGTNPSWSPGTGLSCTFCPNPTASPSVTTTYGITVNDPVAGCLITDSITVEVIPQNSIDAGEEQVACSGDPLQLNGMGVGTLSWSPAGVLNDPSIANPTAIITENTTFVLTATSGNCVLVDSVAMIVTDSVVLTANDESICEGDSVMLQTNGNAQTYQWLPAEGLSDPTIANPIANVTETTEYTVSAAFGSCPSNVVSLTVTVNPLPEASILPIHNFYEGDAIDLMVEQDEDAAFGYDWTPSNWLSCDDCQIPTAAPDTSTEYSILVTDLVTGCEATLFTELRELGLCKSFNLSVPNGFTPNGDGNNDILYVRSTSISSIRMFRVFDRWGAMVFETTDMADGWDGTHDGRPMNPGVFVYYVEALCPLNGSTILKKGNVTLIK